MSRPTCDLPPVEVIAVASCGDQGWVLNSWSHRPTQSYMARCPNRWTQQDRHSDGERRQLPGAHSEKVQEKEVGLVYGLRSANKKLGVMKI